MASVKWNIDYGSEKVVRYESAEQEHRRLGGCGDPNCDWCNPKDGRGGKAPGAGTVSNSRTASSVFGSSITAEMLRQMQDAMLYAGVSAAPKQADSAEYREAREKVKDYLLETTHTVGWDDVIGNEKARTALLEAIEHPITHAELYKHYGMKLSKGVLLYGPPGCGKTMFGKAAAAALARLHKKSVELLVINGPQIQSPWVGKTEETIRDIFAYARLYKKKHGHQLVIFVDEADAILPSREGRPMWNASNVATFLTEMDGMEDSGAFVILATNRPDTLDAALLRDGRCDRKIKVERPAYEDALHIAAAQLSAGAEWLGAVQASDMVDYLFDPMHLIMPLTNPTTNITHHFTLAHTVSGAMVVGLVNRAKGIAFRRDMAAGTRTGLTVADVRAAVDEVLRETKGINNDYALREFVETVAIPFEEAKRLGALN